jgi:hypothetical protein
MDFIVVFSKDGARVVYGSGTGSLTSDQVAVSNPDLSLVRKLPPHEWALVGGKVVPKSTFAAPKLSIFKRILKALRGN